MICSTLALNGICQNKTISSKYANVIKFIGEDKEIDAYRKKHFYKKAKKFRVSEYIIYNYSPLKYLDNHLDSSGIDLSKLDSLLTLENDTITKLSFAPKLSTDSKSNYILYFGKPINNLMFVVIDDVGQKNLDTKYYGLSRRPFIIALVLDTTNKVVKAYCPAPIFE